MAEKNYREVIQREIEHGRTLSDDPELKWGWGTPAGQVRAQRRARLIYKHAHMFPGARTLEFGCGTGLFTEKISHMGVDILAVDISQELISHARKRKYYSSVDFFCGDYLAHEQRDAEYEVVWGSSVLHHIDLRLFLPVFYKVLKAGGWIAFAEPNMLNPQILLERNIRFIGKFLHTSEDETAFIRWRLARQLLEAGFKEVKIVPHEWLHPLIPSCLIPPATKMSSILERIPLVREFSGSLLISARKAPVSDPQT